MKEERERRPWDRFRPAGRTLDRSARVHTHPEVANFREYTDTAAMVSAFGKR
jgi:hypothetical protein